MRYGLSDPKPSSFEQAEEEPGKTQANFDSHLKSGLLHVGIARDIIPYNWRAKNPELDEWLEAVGAAGLQPYLTFTAEESQFCHPRHPCKETPVGSYEAHIKELISGLMKLHKERPTAIPAITLYGAWNEPDLNKPKEQNPLYKNAKRAALFWKAARAILKQVGCNCTMVAGEFSEDDGYINEYLKTIQKNHSLWPGKPHVWGFHDYKDLEDSYYHPYNSYAEAFIKKIKRLGASRIWLSEQGVLLQNGGKETKLDDSSQGENATRQRDAAKDFLKLGEVHLAKEASRVELVDYYLYKGPNAESLKVPGHEHEFDSALLPGEGVTEEQGHPAENPRQAYCVLALGLETCPAVPHTEAAVPGTITASGGAVSLTLDPGGAVTKYQVEYGTSEGYGKTTATATAANENGDQSETVTLSGLEPCTTYHYQAEAENKANEEEKAPGLGGDRTFRTEGSCPATAVSAGFQHVCALRANGVVDCWGADYQGELGNGKIEEGDSTETFAPGQVDDISNATEVSDHEGSGSCALLTTHSVECWGDNSDGQDGNGGEEPESTPVAVSGIADATEVSVGDYDACAVLSTGGVDCWGSNEYGELGDGTMTGPAKCGREPCSRVPVSVSGISNAIAVEAGSRHTCALLSTGHADCWGWNEFGSLGDSSTTNSSTPVEVSGITNATAITGGGDPCALLATGHIKCWGPGGEGGIGNGTDASSTKPEEVSEISNAVAIASNEGQSCALLSTHHIECWGRNEQGELGDGTHTGPEKCEPSYCSTKPVAVSEITDATAISAGFEDSCAVLAGGTVDCWGSNGYGQLGYKPTEELEMRSLPVEISGIP